MAVTQYIGARYVPLFADPMQWDSTRTYEPLTVVYNGGNSYTSRQYVPAGIQIDDDSYWALTGNYNAQIEQYRAEVKQYDGRITAVEGDTAQLKTDTAQLKTDVSQLKTDTAQLKTDTAQLDTDLTETKADVSKNATDIASINDTLAAITPLDAVPTMNSNKGVTSDGVYKALQATVERTRKCIVVIGDSWVMTNPNDTTKPYYSHWVTLFKNRYPDNVFFTRYDVSTPVKIIDTKQEIDVLAADDSFNNADVTDVLMIAGLNGGTATDAISVAAYAREKFNDNLTFTWAQDCYTPLKGIFQGNLLNVDATSYISNANSGINNKYIDLSSFLISPHFFSNDSNNNTIKGAAIIGFHMSQTGSYRLFSFFADYYFGEHLGAWGKQPFNASNFNSCFKLGSSSGQSYTNTAVSIENTFVDYETGSFKIGFYNATPFNHMSICNFPPVSASAMPNLQLPIKSSAIVNSVGNVSNYYKEYGGLYFGTAISENLTLMEGSVASSDSTNLVSLYLAMP